MTHQRPFLSHDPKMAEYPQINVRVDEDFLKRLEDWRRKQADLPGRPEAIRRLVELGFKVKQPKG